ncbi:hypothetical protein TWF506_001191 [Arthrobotrys conoides]|uniref:MYND-type domain-containing protein n=1 Tax=Arthrobotrys conoides TaxID=74498 RepID=A0AAN8NXB7_9PEZI
MLHPEIYDGHGYFYPIGNSPAINLVGYLPPEIDADVLLLGCGDVRNILFTLFTESPEIANEVHRKYHFTCCDVEGAVIARNILLLAMILKNEEVSTMWPIYYDFFMSERRSQTLKCYLAELLSISQDVDTWTNSDLGKILTLGSKYTLAVLRRLWSAWAKDLNEKGKEGQRRKSFEREIGNIVKERNSEGYIIPLAKSASPLTVEVMRAANEHFNHYWKHGTTDRHTEKPTVPNPTFSLTRYGKKLSVHYATNPLAGFHLSTAVVPFESNVFRPMKNSSDFTPLVKCAKDEFNLWCQSFRKARDSDMFTICFFVDEALELCGSLSPPNDFTGIKEINDNNAISKKYLRNHPTQFNVIDVSNSIDHIGAYNILLSILALLRKDHISYLSTETVPDHEFKDESGTEGLLNVFGVDPTSLFGLLGITVVDFMCGQTSISQVGEHQLKAFASGAQIHSRLVWKWIPSFRSEGFDEDCTSIIQQPKLTYDVNIMIDFLAAIYRKLFAIENHTWLMEMEESVKKGEVAEILQHNTRMTFSLLLQKIKRLTSSMVSWDKLVETLVEVVTRECGCLIAPCFLQEQETLNLLHHINVADHLGMIPSVTAAKFGSKAGFRDGYSRYHSFVTCVTLSVPIQAFHKFTIRDMKEVSNPQLQMTVSCDGITNHFCALQRRFGKLDTIDGLEPSKISFHLDAPKFEEDLEGWAGTSTILYSCMVPSWLLLLNGCRVSLDFVSNPHMSSLLTTEIGPCIRIFEADVADHKKVRLSTMFPLAKTFFSSDPAVPKAATGPSNTTNNASNTPKQNSSTNNTVPMPEFALLMTGRIFRMAYEQIRLFNPLPDFLDFGTRPKISRILYRWSVGSENSLAKLLEDKVPILITREGSSGIRISLGPHSKLVIFPYPVGEPIKLGVARMSKYIAIDAPMYDGRNTAVCHHFPIGIASKSLRSIVPWNMHRINLDKSPAVLIDLPKYGSSAYEWISSVVTFSLSKQERANINSTPHKYVGDLISEVKETIQSIFFHYLGAHGYRHDCFVLSCASTGGYMLIYIKAIRLDLSGQSITADCAIVPFEDDTLSEISPHLANFPHVQLSNSPEESKAWLQLSSSLVERCRTWQHKPDCGYIKFSRVPLSAPGLRIGDSPICNCGKGIFPEAFNDNPFLPPLLPYATRAALGPLFPPPYSKELQDMRDLIAQSSSLNISEDPPEEPKKTVCALCGKEEEDEEKRVRKCNVCMKVEYCSRECQQKDWKIHKKTHRS